MIGNHYGGRGCATPHDDVAASLTTLAESGSFEGFDALPTGNSRERRHEALTVSTVIGA